MMNLITVPTSTGGAIGGWRHPMAWRNTVMNLEQMISCAQTAERGMFDCIFFADGNGVRDISNPVLFEALRDRAVNFEPVTLLAALAQHTQNIGLVATVTTTYEEPYTVARKFGSLDHLSSGRAGWNIVTTARPGDSRNFGHDIHMPREERYPRADEFLDVVKGLWDSWAEDAFPENRETGQYLDRTRVHTLNHEGRFFKVEGPLNVSRLPQGYPVLFSAGQSELGREQAARHADCLFAICPSKEDGIALMQDVKGRLSRYGRNPEHFKIIPGSGVFVGRTAEEAEEYYARAGEMITPEVGINYLASTLSLDLTGCDIDGPVPEIDRSEGSGSVSIGWAVANHIKRHKMTIRQAYNHFILSHNHPIFKGTAKQVAEEMADWYVSGACDGFLVDSAVQPIGMERFVDLVVPELQRMGLFRREYTGKTLRERMGLPTPGNQFFGAAATVTLV